MLVLKTPISESKRAFWSEINLHYNYFFNTTTGKVSKLVAPHAKNWEASAYIYCVGRLTQSLSIRASLLLSQTRLGLDRKSMFCTLQTISGGFLRTLGVPHRPAEAPGRCPAPLSDSG